MAKYQLRWKVGVITLIIATPIAWWAGQRLTDQRSADDARFDQLLKVRQIEARFALWRLKPWYRSLSKFTRLDPLKHYATKGDALEKSLRESDYLLGMSFLRPSFVDPATTANSRLVVRPGEGLYYISTAPARPYARLWNDKKSVTLLCRTRDVGHWQQTFCAITNRVRWGDLRKLGGDREEVDCHLPNGEVVDLEACQKWLNDSIAAGWMVGVCTSNRILVASRRKAGE